MSPHELRSESESNFCVCVGGKDLASTSVSCEWGRVFISVVHEILNIFPFLEGFCNDNINRELC